MVPRGHIGWCHGRSQGLRPVTTLRPGPSGRFPGDFSWSCRGLRDSVLSHKSFPEREDRGPTRSGRTLSMKCLPFTRVILQRLHKWIRRPNLIIGRQVNLNEDYLISKFSFEETLNMIVPFCVILFCFLFGRRLGSKCTVFWCFGSRATGSRVRGTVPGLRREKFDDFWRPRQEVVRCSCT